MKFCAWACTKRRISWSAGAEAGGCASGMRTGTSWRKSSSLRPRSLTWLSHKGRRSWTIRNPSYTLKKTWFLSLLRSNSPCFSRKNTVFRSEIEQKSEENFVIISENLKKIKKKNIEKMKKTAIFDLKKILRLAKKQLIVPNLKDFCKISLRITTKWSIERKLRNMRRSWLFCRKRTRNCFAWTAGFLTCFYRVFRKNFLGFFRKRIKNLTNKKAQKTLKTRKKA